MNKATQILLTQPSADIVDTAPRLFCFSHAGAAADRYQSWVGDFAPTLDVRAVTLAGRGALSEIEPISSWNTLIESTAAQIEPLTDLPFALFGHSFGALVAYETARRLLDIGKPPQLLAVAGRAPHCVAETPPIARLPRDAFLRAVADMGGTPEQVLSNASLTEKLLPALRADFALLESYDSANAAGNRPLPCPVLALGSDRDRLVGFREVMEWRRHTAARFECRIFPGDHFFPFTNPNVPDALFDYVDGALNEQGERFQQTG